MHTLIIIVAGLIVLGLFFGVAHLVSDGDPRTVARACRLFIPVWLIVSLLNLYLGVVVAAYPVLTEILLLVIVFGIPAAAAQWLHTRWSRAHAT